MLEKKIQLDKAIRTFPYLSNMLSNYKLQNGNGSSGGIWVFWDVHHVSLTSFEGMEQFLTINVTSVNSQEKYFFMTPSTLPRIGGRDKPYGTHLVNSKQTMSRKGMHGS